MYKKLLISVVIMLIPVGIMYIPDSLKPHYSTKNVLGSQTNLQLFIQPDSGTEPLVQAINNSQKDILLEDYLLSSKDIISALEQAEQRHVQVKVMLEQHPFGGGNLNPKTKRALEQFGISVEWTNPAFALTHEKAMVIDDNHVWVMTQNLTASAFKSNREYDILDTNPPDVKEVVTMFTDDWQRQYFIPSDTNLVISPDTSRAKLEALLTSSHQTVNIEVEEIQDKEFVDKLAQKAKTESIQLIIPDMASDAGNQPAADELKSAGVQIHTIKHPYMHAKLILVDAQRAYIGSVNFSTQSMDQNRELGIIINQADIISQLQHTFQEDWNTSQAY